MRHDVKKHPRGGVGQRPPESGPGPEARVPGGKPRIPVTTLAKRVWSEIGNDNCLGMAAEMSYFFVLAVFPFFIFLAALLSYLPVTNFWRSFVAWVTEYFPTDSQALILRTILGLTKARKSFLSIGFAGATWAATTGVLTLIGGLNRAYDLKESRSFLGRLGLAVSMLFVLSFFFVTSFALFTAGDRLDSWLLARVNYSYHIEWIYDLVRFFVSLLFLNLGVSLMNYVLPAGKRRWRWVSVGSAFIVLIWVAMSASFDYYVGHFSYYPKMYGALGAFVIFMVWTYIMSLILLVGAEIDSEVAKATRSLSGAHT